MVNVGMHSSVLFQRGIKMIKGMTVLLASVLMVGCAGNQYRDSYYAKLKVVDQGRMVGFTSSEPRLLVLKNAKVYSKVYVDDGYKVIGVSGFQSTPKSDNSPVEAVDQAARVGADLVIVDEPVIVGTKTYEYDAPHTSTQHVSSSTSGNIGLHGWTSNSNTTVTSEYTTREEGKVGIYSFYAVYLVRNNVLTYQVIHDDNQ